MHLFMAQLNTQYKLIMSLISVITTGYTVHAFPVVMLYILRHTVKQIERFENRGIFVDNVILHTVYERWQEGREIALHYPRVYFIECVDINLFIWEEKKKTRSWYEW